MSRNPIINAISASGYITLVVAIFNFVSHTQKNKPDTILAPILILSLLTLSVTVMAYLFFYQPFQLFIEGKKKQAVDLFAKTVGIFAGITILMFALLFLGIFK
jgi:VanZ family protein